MKHSEPYVVNGCKMPFCAALVFLPWILLAGIVEDVARWTAGEPPFDDITLLAVEVR